MQIANENSFTEDYLLGGRLAVRQPRDGYRIAIDPIFLAASIDAAAGQTVLDVGAGVGAASLCLALRCPGVRITAIELLREHVRYAVDNVMLNQLRDQIEVLHGDLLHPPPRLAAGSFTHVMANPPYLEATRSRLSANPLKASANHESTADLALWAKFCLLMVKPKGTVTFIHKADRLPEILSYFMGKLGDIIVYPLWPNQLKSTKRVLVRGTKNSNGSFKMMRGMVLHQEDAKYTPEANGILRELQALTLLGD